MTSNDRREFLKAALAAMATAGIAGCQPEGTFAPAAGNKLTGEQTLKRTELVKRLEKLAQSEPPKHLVAAMCYEMCILEVKEVPCPVCERTMIVGEMDEILRTHNVPLKRIQDQKVNAKLIIPEH